MYKWASQVAQMIKNLPAIQKTWVQSLGQQDPLEKGMATHSSIIAQRIAWTEEPGGPQSTGLQRVRHDWMTNTCTSLHICCICNIHLLYPFVCWWTLTLFLKSWLQWITLQGTWGCRYLSKTLISFLWWAYVWSHLQPTPVFLPGEFHGQRSLENYSPWDCKELDTTEQLATQHTL